MLCFRYRFGPSLVFLATACLLSEPTLGKSEVHYSFLNEFAQDLVYLTGAYLCMILMMLVNAIPTAKNKIKNKTQGLYADLLREPAVDIPVVRRQTERRVRLHPTSAYKRFQQDTLTLPVDPASGSWHLDALPYVPNESLQHAFQTMPFDQAVLMLQSVSKSYRDDVASRLELMPAVKHRLEREK